MESRAINLGVCFLSPEPSPVGGDAQWARGSTGRLHNAGQCQLTLQIPGLLNESVISLKTFFA